MRRHAKKVHTLEYKANPHLLDTFPRKTIKLRCIMETPPKEQLHLPEEMKLEEHELVELPAALPEPSISLHNQNVIVADRLDKMQKKFTQFCDRFNTKNLAPSPQTI